MKATALREQTAEELKQLYEDTCREVADIRLKKGSGDSSQQPMRARTLRRDVARIRTVMRERELKSHV